jgi:RNA polymerase sigma-70 factor (ECF subfamily)
MSTPAILARRSEKSEAARRIRRLPDDYAGVTGEPLSQGDAGAALLAVYDAALPQVYGYLLGRCGTAALAEDLTAETFLAAVDAVRRPEPAAVNVGWLVGVARHKLVDHWRREARERRGLRAVGTDPTRGAAGSDDPWDEQLDALAAKAALCRLTGDHRAALTLRYLDDLPVARVAETLGRTLHATEALLVRARAAFRRAYEGIGEVDGRG